jgi:hypothetical protein
MSLNSKALFAALSSHAQTLGVFDRVNEHESMNAPGNGMTCELWFVRLAPFPPGSGLAVTTGLVVFTARIYRTQQLPAGAEDVAVMDAAYDLIAAYSADYTLGGLVRNVDLLGQSGLQLAAQAGWLPVGETKYRTVDVTIPLIMNDLFPQAP